MATKYYDPSGNEITFEQHEQLRIESARADMYTAKAASEKDKSFIEAQRYKQDCRKRALELAAQEVKFVGSKVFFKDPNKPDEPEGVIEYTEKDIVKLADKYYNWLISIPNS